MKQMSSFTGYFLRKLSGFEDFPVLLRSRMKLFPSQTPPIYSNRRFILISLIFRHVPFANLKDGSLNFISPNSTYEAPHKCASSANWIEGNCPNSSSQKYDCLTRYVCDATKILWDCRRLTIFVCEFGQWQVSNESACTVDFGPILFVKAQK